MTTPSWRLIAEPFARLFGIDQLLATQAATEDGCAGAALTGEIDAEPCYGEHKLTHVNRWLRARPGRSGLSPATLERSWFHSDSVSDLPLLCAVSMPVALRPDEHLRAQARRSGWSILELA